MRKLIEMSQETLVQCDNPTCDFIIPNPTRDPNEPISKYINVECPRCGENLLTQEDYNEAERIMKLINWANKWFSWLTLLNPKRGYKKGTLHVHKGVKFTEDK